VRLHRSILDKTLPPNPPDYYNENPELRSRPICGLQVLGDLKRENDEWDGWVYDPRRGKTFSVDVKLQDPNTLMVHGYRALKLMGETKLWTRRGQQYQTMFATARLIARPPFFTISSYNHVAAVSLSSLIFVLFHIPAPPSANLGFISLGRSCLLGL